jgi:hypothetical protein
MFQEKEYNAAILSTSSFVHVPSAVKKTINIFLSDWHCEVFFFKIQTIIFASEIYLF